jgi:DNA ligase-1
VLVYAQPGSGRRAGLHTDCTFALWDAPPDTSPGARLVPFAKAYSGLTQDEIERLDAWIRGHTTAKRGPVREVEPAHVFEIGFEGLAESGRHRSGIAVRFPRILRWRADKRPADADTLDALRRLLRA